MTEEEAKKKWCPFARIVDGARHYFTNRGQILGSNSGIDGDDATKCIGSACMAWRSRDEFVVPEHYENDDEWIAAGWKKNPTGGWVKNSIAPPPKGWCGLAGKP